tara:strand:+ start:2223 stop:2432 length:210 start_codon:yes stop_codon:yes gene_type:complete
MAAKKKNTLGGKMRVAQARAERFWFLYATLAPSHGFKTNQSRKSLVLDHESRHGRLLADVFNELAKGKE